MHGTSWWTPEESLWCATRDTLAFLDAAKFAVGTALGDEGGFAVGLAVEGEARVAHDLGLLGIPVLDMRGGSVCHLRQLAALYRRALAHTFEIAPPMTLGREFLGAVHLTRRGVALLAVVHDILANHRYVP